MGLRFLSMGRIVRGPEELKGPPDESTFNLSDFDLLTAGFLMLCFDCSVT